MDGRDSSHSCARVTSAGARSSFLRPASRSGNLSHAGLTTRSSWVASTPRVHVKMDYMSVVDDDCTALKSAFRTCRRMDGRDSSHSCATAKGADAGSPSCDPPPDSEASVHACLTTLPPWVEPRLGAHLLLVCLFTFAAISFESHLSIAVDSFPQLRRRVL